MEPNVGIYETEQAALAGVIDRLVEGLRPHAVYLFGSRARGDHRPDSDYDLLVVTNPSDGDDGRDHGWVRRPLHDSGVGCDIVPVRAHDLSAELASDVSIAPEIMAKAVRVYPACT